MSPSDDLIYWHLTDLGWKIADTNDSPDGGTAGPAGATECLLVLLHTSPNKMYSKPTWEELWVSSDAQRVATARAKHGSRPSLRLICRS